MHRPAGGRDSAYEREKKAVGAKVNVTGETEEVRRTGNVLE